ncbi:8288_t:CDS:2 [Paraglomus brasilianum]|uniref:8288_t:CDS:1 n=1 Tax=Paraglomus brasilianum TaxID=144538 RepID=A0A9N9FGG1_9GLOM|nr:8288_t:CDS:2 [Paraglomus brasilianum]
MVYDTIVVIVRAVKLQTRCTLVLPLRYAVFDNMGLRQHQSLGLQQNLVNRSFRE